MKIKHMLYSLLLLGTLLPVCLFGLFMIRENDKKVEEILREDLAATSGAQILDINEFCTARQQEMLRISEYVMVRDAVAASLGEKKPHGGQDEEYMEDMLSSVMKHNNCVEYISVLDRNFHLVAASDSDAITDKEGLQAANVQYEDGGFHIGNIYERDTARGKARLVAAVQGIKEEGSLIGYIVEEIPTAYFDRLRQNAGLWKDGTLYLLDGEGNLITAGTPGETSREAYATSEKERENFTAAWNAVDHEKTPSGCISYRMGKDKYLTYFAEFENTDWGIRLSINLSRYKKDVNAYAILVLIGIVCMALILALTSYFLTRRLTVPVSAIGSVLDQVQKEQNYSLRVKNMTDDEIGFVGGKVNELLDYIEAERYEMKQAERDPLTGLKNQKAVEREIQEAVVRAAQNGSRIAVGFVDVDDFRDINNQYGHMEGDYSIRYVASVLDKTVGGILGRNSGDAFLFCLENVESAESVKKMISVILGELESGYFSHIANKQMPLPCSIGVTIDIGTHLSYSSLIHQASEALYQAKEKGKNTYHLISREEMGGNLFGSNERILELIHSLRQSVENDCAGFYLAYQPLLSDADSRVIGAESLLRWAWEPFGEVSPGVFIPLIEDDSCFYKLGNWILRQTLIETLPLVQEAPDFRVHVNVAYSQLVRREFQDTVMEILEETAFPVHNLCLELTERCRALDMSYLAEVMNYFHSQGISISLDDFGTGFSSLNLLRQLPVDNIKIDRSFITNVHLNEADQAIVRSVIQCAKSMNIEVCVEGVETQQCRNYLLQYPELVHQGFYYSRPIKMELFRQYFDLHK